MSQASRRLPLAESMHWFGSGAAIVRREMCVQMDAMVHPFICGYEPKGDPCKGQLLFHLSIESLVCKKNAWILWHDCRAGSEAPDDVCGFPAYCNEVE